MPSDNPDLNIHSADNLPSRVSRLTALQTLSLRGHKRLNHLPAGIFTLSRCVVFFVLPHMHTRRCIPAWVFQQGPFSVSKWCCCFEGSPSAHLVCRRLHRLTCSDCCLKEIPAQLSTMHCLSRLDLRDNEFLVSLDRKWRWTTAKSVGTSRH